LGDSVGIDGNDPGPLQQHTLDDALGRRPVQTADLHDGIFESRYGP
jgi:hypothetical protein